MDSESDQFPAHTGLYRRIDDDFRLRYAKLWQSLIYGDAPAIKENAEAMNAGDMYPLFVAMLTLVSFICSIVFRYSF